MGHPISATRSDQVLTFKKKRTYHLEDFTIPADQVTVIPIVVRALGKDSKNHLWMVIWVV